MRGRVEPGRVGGGYGQGKADAIRSGALPRGRRKNSAKRVNFTQSAHTERIGGRGSFVDLDLTAVSTIQESVEHKGLSRVPQ